MSKKSTSIKITNNVRLQTDVRSPSEPTTLSFRNYHDQLPIRGMDKTRYGDLDRIVLQFFMPDFNYTVKDIKKAKITYSATTEKYIIDITIPDRPSGPVKSYDFSTCSEINSGTHIKTYFPVPPLSDGYINIQKDGMNLNPDTRMLSCKCIVGYNKLSLALETSIHEPRTLLQELKDHKTDEAWYYFFRSIQADCTFFDHCMSMLNGYLSKFLRQYQLIPRGSYATKTGLKSTIDLDVDLIIPRSLLKPEYIHPDLFLNLLMTFENILHISLTNSLHLSLYSNVKMKEKLQEVLNMI